MTCCGRIRVRLLLGSAMHNAYRRPLSSYAAAAQDLLLADLRMLEFWMYSSDVQQHQRQAVQPHLQLLVQCLMMPSVLAQWAPGSRCHGLVVDTLSHLVQGNPAITKTPQVAAETVMSAGSSCSSVTTQHNQATPHSSPPAAASAAAAAAATVDDESDSVRCQEQQPLVVVDAKQSTTQMLSDHETFVRRYTKLDLDFKRSHWMDATLCNIAALCQKVHINPLVHWTMVSGPNSPEQQQLHSLCCSMLKLSASRMSWKDSTANQLRWAAATCSAAVAAAAMADGIAPDVQIAIGLAAAEGTVLNTCSSHRNHQTAPSVGSDCSSRAATAAAMAARLAHTCHFQCAGPCPGVGHRTGSSIPGMATFGRCCLQASQQLKEQIPAILQQRLGLLQGQPVFRGQLGCPFPPQNRRPLTDAAGACLEPMVQQSPLASASLLCSITRMLSDALPPDGVKIEGREALLQELQQLSAAAMDAINTRQATAAPLVALVKQLRVTGLACCSHPVAPMCNNPNCGYIHGDTELRLVTGKSCMCGGCRVAHYCCRACQQEHWEMHKPACKALVAAAAASK